MENGSDGVVATHVAPQENARLFSSGHGGEDIVDGHGAHKGAGRVVSRGPGGDVREDIAVDWARAVSLDSKSGRG